MNGDVKTGLILNASGVVLFVLWLVIQNRLPLAFSLVLALVFCGLLGSSLYYLFRAARNAPKNTQRSKSTDL